MKFMDFCAGIGGGRLGLENNGMTCVAFSEIDRNAEKTYRTLFKLNTEKNFGDLTCIDSESLPKFDVLIGGFPCQTFSILGDRRGLSDADRGQVIYSIAKILKETESKYFILENVKGLANHDSGRTLQIILDILSSIDYRVYYKILNSMDFGVPQMRERIYFVGIRNDLVRENVPFIFPTGKKQDYDISAFLCDEDVSFFMDKKSPQYSTLKRYMDNKYNKNKHSLKSILKSEYLVIDTRQSDIRLYTNRVPTIRKGRQGILYVKNGKLRWLSGYEALMLQGFPMDYALRVKNVISNSDLLAQAGNGMTVNVIREIAEALISYQNK